MGEFGHYAARGADFCIDSWGSGPFMIESGGRTFRFEDSDRFGPSLLNENGDIASTCWPSIRSPFWRAHRIWVRQGRRRAGNSVTCVWDEPKPTTFWRSSSRSRQAFIVEQGDEDGRYIEIPRPPMTVTEP